MSIDTAHNLDLSASSVNGTRFIKNEPDTGLVYTYRTSHTKCNECNIKQWNYRKKVYSNTNRSCQKHMIYNKREDTVEPSLCKQYSCSRCRPLRKRRLLNAVIESAQNYGLTRLLTITFPGKKLRSRVSPDDSFSYTMKKFNHVKEYVKRELGVKMEYINFPRSQKDGYCHLHVLQDKWIPKHVISDICNRLGLGTTNIKYIDVHRVSAYLRADLDNKDHEWFIPKNKKHYTKSHGVTLEFEGDGTDCYFIDIPQHFSVNQRVDKVYDICNHVADRPPPFDYLFAEFQDVVATTTSDWRYAKKMGYCWVYYAKGCSGPLMPTPYMCPNLHPSDTGVRINVFGDAYTPKWKPPRTRQKKFVRDV